MKSTIAVLLAIIGIAALSLETAKTAIEKFHPSKPQEQAASNYNNEPVQGGGWKSEIYEAVPTINFHDWKFYVFNVFVVGAIIMAWVNGPSWLKKFLEVIPEKIANGFSWIIDLIGSMGDKKK
jgi:hypothetical protein